MKKMSDYLDAYGAACGLTSDYQIAKVLGLTKQAVSRYRNDKGCFELDIAWRISDATGIDFAEIIAASEIHRAQRANDSERAGVWRKRLAQVSASLATVFIAVFMFLAPAQPANAGSPASAQSAIDWLLCQIRHWRFASIARPRLSDRIKRLFRTLRNHRGRSYA